MHMHLLFLDESGRIEQDGLFGLGGIAVRDTEWHHLRDVWQDALRTHSWPLDLELKWHGIRTGKVPSALADAIVTALAQSPFTAYVVLLDLPRGRELFPEYFATPEDCCSTALMLLAERFHHLLAAEDDLGLIVVDSRFREEDSRLRRFFAELTDSGTPFMKLERIIEGLFLRPSDHSIGLQCADLVTAIATSAERGNGQARGYLKTLLPGFATHPATGSLDGVGIKRFPDTVAPERQKHKLF
jgi:hypothetical protein